MAIPNEAYTRKEQYLNAMATGDTSGLPDTPYTREEMYLDAIAKGGGGGTGGGVLVVHDVGGTLDKTWQEIVDADFAVVRIKISDDPPSREFYPVVYHGINTKIGAHDINVLAVEGDSVLVQYYTATSADGYPARNM